MIVIREVFKKLISPLSEEEYSLLEESICKEGCRDPLTLWENILIDGHNRYEICKKHDIPFETRKLAFKNEDEAKTWIITNQIARRNLIPLEKAELAIRLKALYLDLVPGPSTDSNESNKSESESSIKEKVGKLCGVSRKTIDRVEKIKELATPEEIEKVRRGENTVKGLYREKRRIESRKEREKEYKNNPLPEGKYDVLLCDPPWKYTFCETKSREIENHYPTMNLDDICSLELPISENAMLFLWVPAPLIESGLKVMSAWGFIYKTQFVWDKEVMGMGYWARIQHEHLLIGVKGEMLTPAPENRYSSVIREKRTEHSKKPDIVYEMLEKMYPERRYLELFARQQYSDKWTVWGNETG